MKTWRIDDIGASTKYYNQWGKQRFTFKGVTYFYFPWANYFFCKRIWPFRGWAKYEELTAEEWSRYLTIFEANKIKPLVAITASWVDEKSKLIPFPEKFPAEAAVLKKALHEGKIAVANHGLTHSIVGRHLPYPRHANRKAHREFWPDLPQDIHREHIREAQKILEEYFEQPITTLVPPGNVWSEKTYEALAGTNIKTVVANRYMLDTNKPMHGVEFVKDDAYFVCHDRDLKLKGARWLIKKIKELAHE